MAFETNEGALKLITYVGVVRDGEILLVEYEEPPNPDKTGLWIPAPQMEYGESPRNRAREVCKTFDISSPKLDLYDVEGFVIGEAWHVMHYFVAPVDSEIAPDSRYETCEWYASDELPGAADFAHGRWERSLAERLLEAR